MCILKTLVFMVIGLHLKKNCDLVNLLFKLDIYVFSSKLKNPKIQRTIYLHF